jgi:deazaflavin-dependent oxidoreductase (nitroreductase family)
MGEVSREGDEWRRLSVFADADAAQRGTIPPMHSTVRFASVSRRILKVVSRLHVLFYKASGGRVGGRFRKTAPVLLLTTKGRRTGKERTTPLLYIEDGGRYAVVASVGGAPRHPAWYLNLRDDPVAAIQIGSAKLAVAAEQAEPDERRRLWAKAAQMYPSYDDYQAKTSREIPIMILTPSAPKTV